MLKATLTDYRQRFRTPEGLLSIFTFCMAFAFGVWMATFNNFAVDIVALNGAQIGLLQSWREIPGFAAFAVVWVLLFMTEQRLALVSLVLLGVGVAITGYLASFAGLLITIMLMSVGFHYYETIRQSLSMQWFDKTKTPIVMGRLVAVNAGAALLAYFLVLVGDSVVTVIVSTNLAACWRYYLSTYSIGCLVFSPLSGRSQAT